MSRELIALEIASDADPFTSGFGSAVTASKAKVGANSSTACHLTLPRMLHNSEHMLCDHENRRKRDG